MFALGKTGPVSRSKVQQMSDLLAPADLALVSAKSWRHVAVAWGFQAKLSSTETCAIGNWLDSSELGGNNMPHRYFWQKLVQATVLRRELGLCLRVLLYDHGPNQWDDVLPGLAEEIHAHVRHTVMPGWPAEPNGWRSTCSSLLWLRMLFPLLDLSPVASFSGCRPGRRL